MVHKRSRAAPSARSRNGVEVDFRSDCTGRRIERPARLGCSSPNAATIVCGPSRIGRAARVPGRAGIGENLQIRDWRARGVEQGQDFGLGIEGVKARALPLRQPRGCRSPARNRPSVACSVSPR